MEAGYFITGANTSNGHIGTAQPSKIIRYGFAVLIVIGTVLSIYYWRDIKRNPAFKLYLTIIVFYAAALWLQNYRSYAHAGSIIAVNARYLFPILLLILVIFQAAYSLSLRNHQGLKLLIVLAIALLFTQGGGILTSVLRAEPTWYWQREKVINTNLQLKDIVKKFELE
jgi:hypothetical protein